MQAVGFGYGVWKHSTSRVAGGFIYGLCMYSLLLYQVLDHWENLNAPPHPPRQVHGAHESVCLLHSTQRQKEMPQPHGSNSNSTLTVWGHGIILKQNKKQTNKNSYS